LELNWSTFLLEIFNFLVLLWILKRFLYQPVLDVITQRRTTIENQLAEARQLHVDAETLKKQYEHRLTDWEQERQQAMDRLSHEIEENRLHQLEKLKVELTQEEKKNRVARTRLLNEAAGPELENRLFDLLLDDLKNIPADQISVLSNKWEESPERILVISAYPLTENKRLQLEETLSKLTGLSTPVFYEQDARLLAGLNITIGAWVLQLNVRDELQGFTEFAREYSDIEH
jgi:F-type H+-transporting ATPase subunit b